VIAIDTSAIIAYLSGDSGADMGTVDAALASDTLIAQTCIDHDVPLITRDQDFRHFVSAGLTLL
jgi:predicted nucleic acid-binding protein